MTAHPDDGDLDGWHARYGLPHELTVLVVDRLGYERTHEGVTGYATDGTTDIVLGTERGPVATYRLADLARIETTDQHGCRAVTQIHEGKVAPQDGAGRPDTHDDD